MEASEFIGQLRTALKPYVGAVSALTPTQVLLRAASLRLLAPEQFEDVKAQHVAAARQRNVKAQWSALEWPDETPRDDAVRERAAGRARPDFKLRRAANKERHQSCIKMKLATFCRDDALAAALRTTALDFGFIMAEASRLLNVYVLQRLEAGLDVNLETSNVVRQAITLVSVEGPGLPVDAGLDFAYRTLYLPLRPTDLPRRPCRKLAQVTTIASQTLHRNIKAHVCTHFGKRLYKWAQLAVLRATAAPGEYNRCRLAGEQLHTVASAVYDALIVGAASLPADGAIARVLLPDEAQLVADWYAGVRASFGHLFPLKGVDWWQLFPVLRAMCADACAQRAACEAHGQRSPRKMLKPATMTPLCGFTTGHVQLDTAALAQVLRGVPTVAPRPATTATTAPSEKDALWQRWFDVGAVTTATREFGHYIYTDGVAVAARFMIVGRDDEAKEADGLCVSTTAQADQALASVTKQLDADAAAVNLPDIHNASACRVLGIDPGIRNPISCVLYDPDAAPGAKSEGFGVSSREWRTMAGIKSASRRRGVWLDAAPDVAASIAATPSTKVATTAAFCEHVAHVLRDLELTRAFYGSVRWRNERFKSYGKSLAAMEAVLARVAPKGVVTVAAFGAAGFSHALRGNPASPYGRIEKGLRKREDCYVVKIGECNTSQKASCCHRQLQPVKGERVIRGVLRRGIEIYGIKVCKHCVTTWDRDLNAARNILAIFLALRGGRPRPQAFVPRPARRRAAAVD